MNGLMFQPSPVRTVLTDDPADILSFAADAAEKGGAALATLVEIRGGAARRLGAHVAVSSSGSFCGYVSGGCVEAAVAAEALAAIAEGRDRMIKYGEGSPFFDIVLPCGGGITIAVHVIRNAAPLRSVVDGVQQRRSATLRYSPSDQQLLAAAGGTRSGWEDEAFMIAYHPRTRVVVSGNNLEANAVASVAKVSGYDVISCEEAADIADIIDSATAVVMLHHDLEVEDKALHAALRSQAFYIGALGSTRTHRRREQRLKTAGWSGVEIGRIKAPIGFFGPTRDSSSLALSVVADIAAARLVAHG